MDPIKIIKNRKQIKLLLNTNSDNIELLGKYQQAKREVKRSARRERRKWINNLVSQTEQAAETHNSRLLYTIKIQLACKKKSVDQPFLNADGELLTTVEAQIVRNTL